MNFAFFKRKHTANGKQRIVQDLIGGKEPDLIYIEQIRVLRAKIEYKVDMLKCRVLAVTSAIAGEGKTLSSANLAVQLASAGRKKILLVDLDLRKSDLAKVLGVNPLPGLTEYLSGTVGMSDIIRSSVTPGLFFISAGTKITAPMDLLGSERFKKFVKDVRGQFDIVLMDTPPIIPVADTLILKDQVDGFIFIFRAGFTPYSMLRQAVEEIGDKNIIGVVLNGVEQKTHSYYQRYYGKYYKQEEKAQDKP